MASSLPEIVDDKSSHCIPFILSLLPANPTKPFIIGLNGVQGAGKTTLVSKLKDVLQKEGIETLVCSIDDLYLNHEDQLALAKAHPDNKLVQHRGEPGTHDIPLATSLFDALLHSSPTSIPSYDKAAHSGAGDRVLSSQWPTVNQPSQPPIRVVIFEGWCVGFRALPTEAVEGKYNNACSLARQIEASANEGGEGLKESESGGKDGKTSTLSKHKLEHLLFVNEQLKGYDVMTDTFDAFIHIDAQETGFVYEWRLEQERALRRDRGTGMSDEAVVRFIDGYYPAYELYTEGLRGGVFKGEGKARQLRLAVGRDRRVVEVERI